MARFESVKELQTYREKLQAQRDPNRRAIAICTSGCIAYGASKLADAFQKELTQRGLADQVDVKLTGCQGFCERGPLVVMHPGKLFYQRVKTEDVAEIIDLTVQKGQTIERLLFVEGEEKACVCEDDVPFYKHQMRLLLGDKLQSRSL